ncbi:hypothetical protein Gogos_011648, partial [Gossypium gossypioides]|nr:hypothetical protein [Gossypium gossypioides]
WVDPLWGYTPVYLFVYGIRKFEFECLGTHEGFPLEMSTSAVEFSGEKVKAIRDKRLIEIFCDICIKEILKGNRPGGDTGLRWNAIKRIVDASDDWWESKLKAVPEAQKFRTSSIDPEFQGKLDQMFMA